MSEIQQITDTDSQTTREKHRQHFTAGLIRWILSEADNVDWKKMLPQQCRVFAQEAKSLGAQPSEPSIKGKAALKAVPAAVIYWLGLITGYFWIIPGAAIGLIGSYFVSESIYSIFKAGKDARFYRTFLHYLLRMENADGTISPEELASLRSIIEFIPAPAEEKKLWLAAIETPDGYQNIIPSLELTDDEKDQILSGCWGLALCDGSADEERELFAKFGEELAVAREKLVIIQQKIEAKLAQHTFLVEETVRLTAILHPALAGQKSAAAEILQLVSLKPVTKEKLQNQIEMTLTGLTNEGAQPLDPDFACSILLSSFMFANYLATPDQQPGISEKFLAICRDLGVTENLAALADAAGQTLSTL